MPEFRDSMTSLIPRLCQILSVDMIFNVK